MRISIAASNSEIDTLQKALQNLALSPDATATEFSDAQFMLCLIEKALEEAKAGGG